MALSSFREERDRVESYRLGVNGSVVKPVDFDAFREVVRHLGFSWLIINQPPPG